jgi:uncharacterized protein YbjT (DUF2867 family)
MQPSWITVVGGSGFVGRHVVKHLAHAGYGVNVLCRDTIAAEFLKTAGTPGQIVLQHANITKPETLRGKFKGSAGVVNLVSILYQSGTQRFARINVAGAQAVAEESARAGVKQLVHISALGIETSSRTTRYGRTKCDGEAAVQQAFPAATILRPGLIIGPEDGFFQRFGRMSMLAPALPLVGGGATKFQPVLVDDIARAVLACLQRPETASKTYELVGDNIYSFKELLQQMLAITKRRNALVTLPTPLAYAMGLMCELLPLPPIITRDQVRLLAYDNVASETSLKLRDLGITPATLQEALPALLARYIKE